jgi:hypothetical protein
MSVLSTPYGFLRMAVGAKAFVDDPISLSAARAIIEKGMQTREAAFRRKLEAAVWTNPPVVPTSSCSAQRDASQVTWTIS